MIPHDTITGNVIISDISPDSPAAMSGLTPGDHIVSTDGKIIESTSDLIQSITLNSGSEMEWIILRDSSPVTILLTPRVEPPAGQGATGIRIELADTVTIKQSHPLIEYAKNHDNLIITPHIGGATYESMHKTEIFMAEKLSEWVKSMNIGLD